MATKKSFKTAENKQEAKIYDTITNTDEPVVQDELETLRTQGHKGMKLPRINLAFSKANYDFIKVMAGIRGQNLTVYINSILDAERERMKTDYLAAKALVEKMNQR